MELINNIVSDDQLLKLAESVYSKYCLLNKVNMFELGKLYTARSSMAISPVGIKISKDKKINFGEAPNEEEGVVHNSLLMYVGVYEFTNQSDWPAAFELVFMHKNRYVVPMHFGLAVNYVGYFESRLIAKQELSKAFQSLLVDLSLSEHSYVFPPSGCDSSRRIQMQMDPKLHECFSLIAPV